MSDTIDYIKTKIRRRSIKSVISALTTGGSGSGEVTLTGDVTGTGTGTVATTISSGSVDISMLSATGTPSASTYLRGDNTWATPAGGSSTFADDVFRIQDNGDATKEIAFEASGITTGTTRTFTAPNASGTLALTSDLSGWLTGTLTGDVTINGGDFREVNLGTTTAGTKLSKFKVYASSLGSDAITLGAGDTDYGQIQLGDGIRSIAYNNLGDYYQINHFGASYTINQSVSSVATTKFRIRPSDVTLNLGSDATGDTYYRNSSGYFTRLPIGSEGTLLRAGASVPAYSTFTIPNTISALSAFVANSANVLTEVTPAAGQSIRVNAGGTAWEAYTPGSGGSSVLSDITDATGTNTIDSDDYHQIWDWNTLSSGTGMSFRSSSTAAASNTLKVVSIEKSGANASSSQTTTALNVSNTSTGTGSVNYGLFITATGGTTNRAIGTAGDIYIAGSGKIDFASTGQYQSQSSAGSLHSFQSVGTGSSNILAVNNITNVNPTSGVLRMFYGLATFNPSSGTATFHGVRISPTLNQTSTASGGVYGFDYSPTATSVLGDHLSFRATAGNMLVPASSYHNYGTTVGTSGYGFRDNAGVMEYKNSGGSWTPF